MADEFDDFDDIDALMASGDDLDIEDIGDGSGGSTSVVGDVTDGIVNSLDIDMTASKIKNSMLDSLPGDLGSSIYSAETAMGTITETFDKELIPLRKAASSTLGGLAEVLPEGIGSSVKSLKEWIDGDGYGDNKVKELTDEEKIQNEVNGILVKTSIEEQVNNKITNLQAKKDSELLSMIAEATTKTSIYKTEFDANYYRRSLELQLKQVMTSVRTYDLLKEDSVKRNAQFDAIVKNTSLPDFVKSKTSDIAKQMALGGIKDGVINAFTKNDALSNLTKYGKGKIVEGVGAATEFVGLGSDMTELIKGQLEMGQSLTQLVSTLAADAIVDKGVKELSKVGMEKLYESNGGVKILGDFDTFVTDPQKALANARQKIIDDGGSEYDLKYGFLKEAELALGDQYKTSSTQISNVTDIREASMIDKKFTKTVDTVIPGYLSKIVSVLNTIKDNTSSLTNESNSNSSTASKGVKYGKHTIGGKQTKFIDEDELVYDFEKNKFVTKKDIKKDINTKIDKHVLALAETISSNRIDSHLVPDHLSIAERNEVALATAKYLLSNKSIAPANLEAEGFLKDFKDKELRNKVRRGLELLKNPTNKQQLDNRLALRDKLRTIKQTGISNFSDIAKSADINNSTDVLMDMGIVDENSSNIISQSSITKVYEKRIGKETAKVYKDSKLSLSEQALVDNTKERLDKLKESYNKKDERVKRSRDSIVKRLKDDTHGHDGYKLGLENSSLTTDKQNELIISKTTGLSEEDANAFKTGFMLGVTQGLNEQKNADEFKTKKQALATKVERKLTRVGKKLSDDEKKNLTKRMSKETTLSELEEIGSFNFGGWTLSGPDDEVAGVIHRNEYVINKEKLDNLIKSVSSGNVQKIVKFSTNIVADIDKQPNELDIDNKKIDSDGIIKSFIKKHTSSMLSKAPTGVDKYLKKDGGLSKLGVEKLQTLRNKAKLTSEDRMYLTILNDMDGTSTMFNKTKSIGDGLMDKGDGLRKSFDGPLTNLGGIIKKLIKSISSSIGSLTSGLTKGLTYVKDKVVSMFSKDSDVINKLSETKDTAVKTVNEQLDVAKKFVKNGSDDVIKELEKQGVVTKDKDGNVKVNLEDKLDSVKDKLNESTKKQTSEGLFKRATNMASGVLSDVKGILTGKVDVTADMINDMSDIQELIDSNGMEAVMKSYLVSKPFPKSQLSANSLYKSMFITIDPSGSLWERVIELPNYLDALEKVHVQAIEEGQQGILSKTLDKGSELYDKGTGMVGKLRDKLINSLPEPLRGPAKKLLNNRVTKLLGKTGTRLKNVAKKSLSVMGDEMRIIGQEGKELFINDDGKLQMPSAYKLAKFAGKSYFRSMKAVSGGVREFYKGTAGTMVDAGKIAGSAAWRFTGGGAIKAGKRFGAKQWAKIKPPVPRDLYNAWLDGQLTAKDVTDALKTEDEKQHWHDWLKENTKAGITLPDILLKGGEWFLNSTVSASKTTRKSYSILGKVLKTSSKVAAKFGMEFSGLNDAGRAIKRKLTTPDIDKELFEAWKRGELKASQVTDALKTQEEKDAWISWLTATAPVSLSLAKALKLSGKWYSKTMSKASEGIEKGYKSGFKNSTVVGTSVAKKLYDISGIDEVLHGDTKVDRSFKTLLELIPAKMRYDVIDDISELAEEMVISNEVVSILNDDVKKIKKKDKVKLVKKITGLVSLYLANENSGDMRDSITNDIRNLLLFLKSIKLHHKDEKRSSKVKGSDDIVNGSKVPENDSDDVSKEFLLGGWTGDGDKNSLSGKVHNREYVMNSSKVKQLIDGVNSNNDETIAALGRGIAGEITKKSKLHKLSKKGKSITKSILGSDSRIVKLLERIAGNTEELVDEDRPTSLTRDGNRESMLAKLYGKKDAAIAKVTSVVKGKSSLLKTLMKFGPILIGGLATMAKKYIVEPFNKTLKGIATMITTPIKAVSKVIGGLGSFIVKGISSSISGLATTFKSLIPTSLTDKITDKVKNVYTKSKDAVKSVLNKGKNVVSSVWEGTKSLIGKTIPNGIKNLTKKIPIAKIKSIWNIVKSKLFKKLGTRAATSLVARTTAKFIPGVGTPMLMYDAARIGWAYFKNKTPLKQAVSEQFLGFNVFGNDVAVDADGRPVKPDEEILDDVVESVNNTNYKRKPVNNDRYKRKTVSIADKVKSWFSDDEVAETPTKYKVKTDNIKIPIKPLVNDLKRDEGVVLHKYKDSLGYETIGVGHLLDKSKGGKPLKSIIGSDKETITESEADVILVNDINETSKQLYTALPWLKDKPLNIQKDLTNMAFNLGVDGLTKFKKALAAIEEGDYKQGAMHLYDSQWRKQVKGRATRIIADVSSTPSDNIDNTDGIKLEKPIIDMNSIGGNIPKRQVTTDKKDTYKQHTTKVNVDMGSIDESKHLNDMNRASHGTYELMKESVKVQQGMYNKLDELVSLQKEQLSLMGEANKQRGNRKSSNNIRHVDDYQGHFDHATATF